VVETVIFAMLAAFLGLRLYAVLGKRTGHEQTMAEPADEAVTLPKAPAVVDDKRDVVPARVVEDDPLNSVALAGVRRIMAVDPRFNPSDFIDGAKSAYQLILEAFWDGDPKVLALYVAPDALDVFAQEIEKRNKAKLTMDNRLIRIDRAVISDVELTGKTARITVQFDADVSAVTRNKKGEVVAGSTSDALPTHDIWTFERELKSSDPNWVLVDTDESV
jgi:predicted lipid-binding transport protein (Tim44 family)